MSFSDKQLDSYLDDESGNVKLTSDQDIDNYLDDKTTKLNISSVQPVLKAVGQTFMSQLPQMKEAGTLGLSSAPETAQRIGNYVQNKPNPAAQTLLQAASNRPDVTIQAGTSMIPGAGLLPAAARVAGSTAAGYLSRENKGANAAFSGGLQVLLEALPYGAGKVAPYLRTVMSKGSGVEAQAIKKLADNPSLLFTGPNKAEAQAAYKAAAEHAGLSSEVSDDVLFGAGKRFVKNVVDAVKKGEEVSNQSMLDARQTIDDFVEAAKRSGKFNKVKGFTQRRNILQEALAKQAPELRAADKTWSEYATRDQFMRALPVNANGEPSVGKAAIGSILGVVPALSMSPYLQGVATAAVGAISKVPRQVPGVTLQTIRQFLINKGH